MDIEFKSRNFYPDELRILRTLRNRKAREGKSKIKFYHFIVAAVLGAGFSYLAMLIGDGFWVLPFGTLAVFSFAFIAFAPYEIYKMKKKHKVFLQQLDGFIGGGTVQTCVVNAKRIALAGEYEDEGDLFIVEVAPEKVLYLWDHDYVLRKKFPCRDFEIYEDSFYKLFGRMIYPLSEPVQPVIIDKKAKWKYMERPGVAEHLATENISFDKIVAAYNGVVAS